MLKILLPMTLPTAMSGVSLNAACRLTVICGALLPSATTVKPMSNGRIFRLAAIRMAQRTSNSAPAISKTRPQSSCSRLHGDNAFNPKMLTTPRLVAQALNPDLGCTAAQHIQLFGGFA